MAGGAGDCPPGTLHPAPPGEVLRERNREGRPNDPGLLQADLRRPGSPCPRPGLPRPRRGRVAGLTYIELTLELALAFHHAVRDADDEVAAAIARLRENTRDGDYAYYGDIVHFMTGLPLDTASTARWTDRESVTRQRWHALVTARRNHLADGP